MSRKKNDRKFQICNREIFYKFYVGRLKDFKYLNETMGWKKYCPELWLFIKYCELLSWIPRTAAEHWSCLELLGAVIYSWTQNNESLKLKLKIETMVYSLYCTILNGLPRRAAEQLIEVACSCLKLPSAAELDMSERLKLWNYGKFTLFCFR